MNILAVSDYESPYLWDYYEPGRFDDVDLILAAGDLAPEYLSFLVTLSSAPVLYIRGNHDSRCHPRYFIHGHVHKNYCADFKRCRMYGQTTVINAYEYYTFTF